METYIVTGMSCAACQSRVEKAVSKVDGVTECTVSLLTNSMNVEGTANRSDIIRAVTDAGYGILDNNTKQESSALQQDALEDHETPKLKRRLFTSIGFLLVLMYISMGHNMLNWPLPAFMNENPASIALTQMLLAIIIILINSHFFTSGFSSLFHGAPNMDTLVALGSAASFGYSLVEFYMMLNHMHMQNHAEVHDLLHNLYFESAAMIPALITVGKTLEAYSKGKTTDALKSLMKLSPETATLLRDGQETTVSVSEVIPGDIFVVRPGESIPVDGLIIEGTTAIDESSLTGESIPVDKQIDDMISAATINQTGYIKARATRVGQDTTFARIIKMVADASTSKPQIARIADAVSSYFVPAVIIISIITLIGWLLAGKEFSFAIGRAISVMVISCPCALGLATPVAIMVGNGVGFRNGILFKTAVSLEQASKMDTVVLDKTGTITNGTPVVTDIIPSKDITEEELLKLAGNLESASEHPLAKSIVNYCQHRNIEISSVTNFQALPGNGVMGSYGQQDLIGGSLKFVQSQVKLSNSITETADGLSQQGKTPLLFVNGGKYIGLIAVADTIKDSSVEAVRQLHEMGLDVIMLTGDNQKTAEYIGSQAGIDHVIAGVLPDGKENVIRNLKKDHKVIMVGDGINDAPALTAADLGIAIGSGTDVSIDAADIVLTKSDLIDVPAAIRLSRHTLNNIYQNLFWAFFYNVLCIPLAAGLYQLLLNINWEMSPMLGAAAMSISSFTVCMNALRLNLVRIYDSSHDKKIKFNIKEKENVKMEKTIRIEGMMCEHCQATVKKALEKIEGVASADVSWPEGKAIVTFNSEVADDVLIQAIEDRDYKVIGIE